MDQYQKVIDLYDRLCVERNDSTLWAANILDASQGITSQIVWQNFYAYMANESHVFTDTWQDSLGEQVDKGLTLKDGDVTFKTKKVQNGNVTIIRMTPENFVSSNKENGKSLVSISQTISEETSLDESQRSDEKCEF